MKALSIILICISVLLMSNNTYAQEHTTINNINVNININDEGAKQDYIAPFPVYADWYIKSNYIIDDNCCHTGVMINGCTCVGKNLYIRRGFK